MMAEYDHLTDEAVRRIAQESVKQTLRELGIDPDDWQEVQKDLAWARRARTGSNSITKWIIRGSATAVGTGAVYWIWKFFSGIKIPPGG